MAENQPALGARIRQLRKARGWSQERLAEISGPGTDQTMISRIENRADYEPSVYAVAKIARALGVPIEALLRPGGAPVEKRRTAKNAGATTPLPDLERRVETLEAWQRSQSPSKKKRRST
ncbi:MAG TPA: helix-turn-helix transcriptional regulator [Candidatus Baltobacteraceae bacterium]